MSYWSHHVEEYDEICLEAVTDYMLTKHPWSNYDRDEVAEYLSELQCEPLGCDIFSELVYLAHRQLAERERGYWERLGDNPRDLEESVLNPAKEE